VHSQYPDGFKAPKLDSKINDLEMEPWKKLAAGRSLEWFASLVTGETASAYNL